MGEPRLSLGVTGARWGADVWHRAKCEVEERRADPRVVWVIDLQARLLPTAGVARGRAISGGLSGGMSVFQDHCTQEGLAALVRVWTVSTEWVALSGMRGCVLAVPVTWRCCRQNSSAAPAGSDRDPGLLLSHRSSPPILGTRSRFSVGPFWHYLKRRSLPN